MTLTDRLEKLRDKRGDLMTKRKALKGKHKSAELVDRDLRLVTAKVLKFELKAEKVK